ncbi:hypothetical protein BDF14DRAFT_1745418 [Spinellus fusiger]|nr:hypothetical protein BDF14DRAFT_1745418 [Spinellus fusiger]
MESPISIPPEVASMLDQYKETALAEIAAKVSDVPGLPHRDTPLEIVVRPDLGSVPTVISSDVSTPKKPDAVSNPAAATAAPVSSPTTEATATSSPPPPPPPPVSTSNPTTTTSAPPPPPPTTTKTTPEATTAAPTISQNTPLPLPPTTTINSSTKPPIVTVPDSTTKESPPDHTTQVPPPVTPTEVSPEPTTNIPTQSPTQETAPNPPQTGNQPNSISDNPPSQQTTRNPNVPIVTITSSGTKVFTRTYTSFFGYTPTPISSTTVGQGGLGAKDNNSSTNLDTGKSNAPIIGGVLGGVGFLATLGIAAFLILRRKKQQPINTTFDDELDPYTGPYETQGTSMSQRASVSNSQPTLGATTATTAAAAASIATLPRHLVAPLQAKNDMSTYPSYIPGENNSASGYYEETLQHYPVNSHGVTPGYYHDPNVPPSYGQFHQVPNELESAVTDQRHVPHLMQTDVPHSHS